MSAVISETINGLSMADAFRYYRDELRWQVYPADGPESKKGGAGKKPSVTRHWEYDPQDCDVAKWFNGSGCHNIGFAPTGGIVVVDLDSREDQGRSVEAFLAERPELAGTPRHRTRGGVHLMYRCRDLLNSEWKHPNGRPYHDRLQSRISQAVSAELFHCDHLNVVVPPSVHAVDDFVYRWETFGEMAEVSWQWLQENFGFVEPPRPGKEVPWHLKFEGDLHSLDLRRLLESIGYAVSPVGGKAAIFCPWRGEHSDGVTGATPGGSTVIWEPAAGGSVWPGFKCLHAHCDGRGLRELLEWAESQEKGIVDRFCRQSRRYAPGQVDEKGRHRVLHPSGRLDSEVHSELGHVIGASRGWFVRDDRIAVVRKVPSGFAYSGDPEIKLKVEAHVAGLSELSPLQARSSLERYVVPGVLAEDGAGQTQFMPKSFSTDFCAAMIQSDQFKGELPLIARVLTVPLPFRPAGSGRLVYPVKGYDPGFLTYLVEDAPEIDENFPLAEALKVIEWVHREFCFTNEQSRIHAIARFITPFARAILGWTTRVPLWYFCANRPGAGKDYLNGCTLILYEGMAFEDAPVGRESEETLKRIVSAARSGRRFMHFSNCQVYLQDENLAQAITNRVIAARSLGSNTGKSDLMLQNEMEYSLSGQAGLTFREDFVRRMRQIELAYSEEDANTRRFENEFLHERMKERRAEILSGIGAFFRNWAGKGFPKGPTPFTSYPEWAQVVGGVMAAAGLGDPCLPFEGRYKSVGGDLRTRAMTELFRVCRQQLRGALIDKKRLCGEIHEEQSNGNEALSYFGPLEESHRDARSNQTKLGIALHLFNERELGGVKLLVDESAAKSQQHKYQFVRVSGEDTPRVERAERQKVKAEFERYLEGLAALGGTSVSVEREKAREGAAQAAQASAEALEQIMQMEQAAVERGEEVEDWLKTHKTG